MTDYYDYSSDPAFLAFYFILFAFGLFVALINYVLSSWFMARMFAKMGETPWKAWVPFYNTWLFLEWGGLKGWWIFIGFATIIPFVGSTIAVIGLTVVTAMAAYNIAKGFSKDTVWVVLYILLPLVWLGILGFDSSKYNPALNTKSLRPVAN